MESADALMEEKKLMSEAKYRNYMSNIDKALRNFEYSSEWADLISALGKLSKTISGNTQYQVIPRRIKISKRLAQCMHPALPSGVHLKALETYAVIFSKIGPERLATELFIYGAGLFPLLGYAAMNVRPALLGIYETYFVPLGEKLRPALSGFLSGVLPGYENGLDHFDRTNSLLMQVCNAVNPMHFYTVLWECVATNSSIRLPAITYILEHFNKRLGMQEQVFIMGHNRDIMMSALCACLNDSLILVQRNTLEFLLLGFPMHTIYLNESDLIKLVTNGLNTILRRDMSLNRRLYSWLLGSEVSKSSPSYETASMDGPPEEAESYFERHSKHILIQSLISTLKFSLESTPVELKPYRIMVSLLDKAEIGSAVLDHVLCDIIRTMSLSSGNVEVVKSANLLFATFDPAYIWSFMTSIYEKSCKKVNTYTSDAVSRSFRSSLSGNEKFHCVVGSGDPSLIEICFLTEFLLETISLEMYNETTRIYLPKVFLAITQLLTIHLESIKCDEICSSLKLCMKIVSRVQPMIMSPVKVLPRINQDHSSSDEKVTRSLNNDVIVTGTVGAINVLEKSKSDSKLNQFQSANGGFVLDAKDTISCVSNEDSIHIATSNNMSASRKSQKKKKSKSYSKLSELDKEICPDTGQLIDPQPSSSDFDTPLTTKKLKLKTKPYMQLRSSPKKVRPKNIPLTVETTRVTTEEVAFKRNEDEVDEQPKSAPAEELQGDHAGKTIFDYQEFNIRSPEEFSILEKCIRQYEVFFEVYLSRKVLHIGCHTTGDAKRFSTKVQVERREAVAINVEDIFKSEQVFEDTCSELFPQIDKLFETLRVNVVSRSTQLQSLLSRSLNTSKSTSDISDGEFQECQSSAEQTDRTNKTATTTEDSVEKSVNSLIALRLSTALRNGVKLALNLLVEMSTFPNCNKTINLEKIDDDVPSWLKVLCLTAAYTQNDKELHLASITTLFDLISLLKSQTEHTTSPGVTFVVMLPLLKFGHVTYIENKTRIFQLITSILWNYLCEPSVDPSQVASLLYQLHNCLESGLVETIIGNRMYSCAMHQQFSAIDVLCSAESVSGAALKGYRYDKAEDIKLICVCPSHTIERTVIDSLKESESKSFRKFELLWHLGRDKQPSKGFEKTLLKVLDTLGLSYYMSARTFVTKWLQASLLRDDLSRLTKPLYKILLSPNTQRIGVVHLRFVLNKGTGEEGVGSSVAGCAADDTTPQADELLEQGVYAISSEFGNIKYHMDVTVSKKRSPMRSFQKKLFGVTLSSKNKTSNFVSDKLPPTAANFSDITQEDAAIGLIVNPLDNSPDFDDELDIEENEDEPKIGSLEKSQERDEKNAINREKVAMLDSKDNDNVFEHDYTDDTETSTFESESENRETSVEKDDSLTISSSVGATNNLKRFVGDCERVTEMLTQHERTKNRKTYRLTREKTVGDASAISAVGDETLPSLNVCDEDTAHPADEYFSNVPRPSETNCIEVAAKDIVVEQTTIAAASESEKPLQKSASSSSSSRPMQKKKYRHMHSVLKQKKEPSSPKKSTSGSDKKRLSCISKTSTDSNNSFVADNISTSNVPEEQQQPQSSDSERSDEEISDVRSQTLSMNIASSTTINVEDKRRCLSLETNNKPKLDWELTQEVLEKGKQNVQILRQNAGQANGSESSKRSSTKSGDSNTNSRKLQAEKLNFLHNHMLIYFGVYDTKQTLYALQTLRNIIACDMRTFLCLSITTSVPSGSMKQLLIRHRKSISGKGFTGSITNSEFLQNYRACMHLELLVTVCLYYARGFFHRESSDGATSEAPTIDDVAGNCRVQLASIELLTLICTELIDIVKGMGKGLACYIADLMIRCKLQKVILHCLNSIVSIYNQELKGDNLAEQTLSFNNPQDENLHADAFQIQLLRLLMTVMKLEYEVTLLKNDSTTTAVLSKGDDVIGNISPTHPSTQTADASPSNLKYLPNCLISQQPMFLAAVLNALQDEQLRHLHRNWTDLVTASLNCFTFGSLTNIVIRVLHQLCNNIDKIAKLPLKEQCNFPPDYVVSQLEAITILCHYCLLDNTQQTTLSHLFNQAYPQTSVSAQNSNTGQLLNNIVHSFLSTAAAAAAQSTQTEAQSPRNPQLLAARNALLTHLSRIVASVAAIWDSELGQVRQVKQQLMEFLSPVSLHHGANFLAAVAVTWQERGEQHRRRIAETKSTAKLSIAEQYQRNSMPQACAEQLNLVGLVSSIRVMPMDSFVQTLHQVVKSPPPIHRPPAYLNIEVSALELFYFYMKSAPAPQLGDSWSSLLALLRDSLNLIPPAQFSLLMLLNEFVQRCPQMPLQDKKDIRDLHDVTSRLVESLSNVAGSCLEQTTWLRRNLAVKEDISPVTPDGSVKDNGGITGHQQYSVQAQSVLAAILANLLDVAYGSQEKDKVVTIITTLLYNITPYLKNHTTRNIPSFYACSSLLANLSGYQYTRKAWRKDMLDLLLDNAFFQMDISCLPFWKQIMDSLMTYDNTTFRELMGRVSLTQTGSLNIFTSRELEYEQRAMLLKRLAFVIYCSEFDQYHKYMPEIQEQLTNSLRLLSMVPSVQAAVFLCFRVLLLRMSADHVTSLWPIIIAEMVQVFLAMEQELKSDSEDLSQQMRMLSGMEVSWSSNSSNNGLNSQSQLLHWRSVQLEASKLLELGCVLPATNLPHFQMYRWAFVGTEFDVGDQLPVPITNGNVDETTMTVVLPSTLYIPHIRRIARLMDMKYAVHSPANDFKRSTHLVLTCQQISSLQDLYSFFSMLSITCPNPPNFADTGKEAATCLAEVEDVLSRDFLERMPTSTTPR